MRRAIQDLVASIDPNVKIEPEVEDVSTSDYYALKFADALVQLLLDIADEFIDSMANLGCRLAKCCGSATLEVWDLELHICTSCVFSLMLVYE